MAGVWHRLGTNPAAVRFCESVSDPASQRECRPWARILLLFECFAWAPPRPPCVALLVSDPASERGCRPQELFLSGPKVSDPASQRERRPQALFLWVPKVTGSILSGCILLGPAAVRVFRIFCLAWARILLLFECFAWARPRPPCVALLVSDPASERGCRPQELFLSGPKVTGSILSDCILLGMGSNPAWHGLDSCCCSSVSHGLLHGTPALRYWFRTQPRSEGADLKNCFWIPKVTGSILSHCILLGMGSNPAAVRVFRMGSSTALPRCATGFGSSLAARVPATRTVFMDSKGDVKHFVGLHFVWHGLESCCCSSVSHGLLHGTPALRYWFRIQPRSESAGHKNCFYGFQR